MPEVIRATPDTQYAPAVKPTMYFIGVTTGQSSIVRIFPRWVDYLEMGDVALQGVDCQLHDHPLVYRRLVEFIKQDPLSRGALITTHKIDLLKATRDLFEFLEPQAQFMNEVSCISKRKGQLCGHAVDALTSGLALEAFLPPGHWQATGAAVLCLGAGGSAIAITSYLMETRRAENQPSRIVVSDRSAQRLEEIKRIHDKLGSPSRVEYHHTLLPEDNDALLQRLKSHSLVINASGLGKDAPGSPLTEAARFPQHGFAWDFNYRGHLVFLDQARAQADRCRLTIEDGWRYFIHGWTRVIAEVFEVEVPLSGPRFEEISRIAREVR